MPNGMLTDRELRQLRADLNDLLPSTCTILRPVASNDNGYSSEAYGTAVASTDCRIDPNGGTGARAIAGREGNITDYILTVGYDVDIRASDRVVISSVTYNVTQLFDNHSLHGVKRAWVAQIK